VPVYLVRTALIYSLLFFVRAFSGAVKSGAATSLRLLEPSKGCTMLLHFPEGASQMARVDSRDDGSDLDSGIR
jgi:hypothetical protein